MYPQFQNGVGMLVFCPTTINLIVISPIIHKLLKNLDVGGVNGNRFAII